MARFTPLLLAGAACAFRAPGPPRVAPACSHGLEMARRAPLLPAAPASRTRTPQPWRHASLRMQSGSSPDGVERAIACSVYLLPFLDGFPYGLFVYRTVPGLGQLAFNFLPLVNTFESIPFAGLIFFVILSYFSRNSQLSRFVRFNIQQAILLDILLIIPGFFSGLSRMVPAEVSVIGSNAVFYVMALTIGYSVFSNVQGKTPDKVPILSEAAASQIDQF
ncbi:hypothetical protein AB1Y20_010908 [Prymnesium parvum]|uniref:Protein TIC 20 n=1 Tax=Prymnesium parvum TaxID=97485 RepID=A0AB34IU43_PRYPA|mmetsp:Transcript_2496/g.5791  ORF Transcript_2496/g.5791 Transcript_2496/m.5791 type:complete len:220 (-) Transcript_2496:359-1018(-)